MERLRYQAQLELGQLDAAGENLLKASGDPFELLEMMIACRLKSDEIGSQKWLELAFQELDARDDDTRRAAELLRKAEGVSWVDVQQVQLEPSEKAVLLIALAQRQPPVKRAELLSLAERLNYNLGANHCFRDRAIKSLRTRPE